MEKPILYCDCDGVIFNTIEIAFEIMKKMGCNMNDKNEVDRFFRLAIDWKEVFDQIKDYDPNKGFSISQKFMENNGLDHQAMTSKQRELFKELYESGRANTMKEHTRIAREALKAGGAEEPLISDLVNESLRNLTQQGVTSPSRIPWFSINR